MPEFVIKSPEGQKYRITAPSGATEQDVLKYVQEQHGTTSQRGVIDKLLGLSGERYITWPERAVRDAASIPERAIEAAGSAPPGSREATENMVGPAADAAMTVAGAAPAKGVAKEALALGEKAVETKPEKFVPSRSELKEAYGKDYQAAADAGVTFKPENVEGLQKGIISSAEEAGHDEILSPKVFKVVEKLTGRETVPELEAVRKLLGRLAGGPDPYEKAAATHAISKIDAFMKEVPHIMDARANYAARARSQLIEKAQQKAERRAASSGTGSNIDNSLRQEIRKLLDDEKKSRGFSKEEKEQMEKIIEGSFTGDALRWLGKLAPTGVIAGPAGMLGGFMAGGAPGAVAVPALGYAAKKLSDHLTKRKVQSLDEMVRGRSPLAERNVLEPKE